MTYDRHREDTNEQRKAASMVARDIAAGWDAEAPTVADLELRERCRSDLRLYLSTYYPECFYRDFNGDQLEVIDLAERAILTGDMAAVALPRGGGKTQILLRAVLWAAKYGHRLYPVLLAAKAEFGDKLLTVVKRELATNELLRRPFRAVVYPIRRLEGDGRKSGGQLFRGERTCIGWGAERLVFPIMPGDAFDGGPNVSGSVIETTGITAALRGKSALLPGGRVIRPDFVALDDVQDRESAQSPTQIEDRLRIINADVLALGGVGNPMAAIAALTVIAEGDVADQLTDRERNPQWRGVRRSFLRSWPTRMDLWDQYIELRRDLMRRGESLQPATEFYRKNRAAMDEGAAVADEHWKDDGDLSALQWAMNTRDRIGHPAFASEFQNAPERPAEGLPLLTAAEIAAKLNRYDRAVIPARASHLTAFVDVGDSVLHYCITAWADDFTGWVVTYGVYPEQRFTSSRKLAKTLLDATPGAGVDAALRAGLLALTDKLLGAEFRREDGAVMKVERCLIDRGFKPDVVYEVCRASTYSAILSPCLGEFIGLGRLTMERWARKAGERHGWHFVIRPPAKGRALRMVVSDVNFFKTLIHDRLRTPMGDPGCLSLWGKDAREHHIFATHLTAETAERVQTKTGELVDQWTVRPGFENHYFDALVGTATAAAMCGCRLPGANAPAAKPEVIDLSKMPRRPLKDWLRASPAA